MGRLNLIISLSFHWSHKMKSGNASFTTEDFFLFRLEGVVFGRRNCMLKVPNEWYFHSILSHTEQWWNGLNWFDEGNGIHEIFKMLWDGVVQREFKQLSSKIQTAGSTNTTFHLIMHVEGAQAWKIGRSTILPAKEISQNG